MSSVSPIIIMINYRKNGELKSIYQYIDHREPQKRLRNKFVPFWLLVMLCYLIFAILIILAASLYVKFSKRPGLYNESCASRSCLKQLNLKCINGTCLCPSTQYYMKGCFNKKTYLQQCMGNSSYCINGQNLVCLDGVCKCNRNSYWKGSSCVPQLTYATPCNSSSQCLAGTQMTCDSIFKICSCPTNRFWDSISCIPLRALNETCSMVKKCNNYVNLLCQNGYCNCASSFYLNGSTCALKQGYGNSCTNSIQCNDSAGLVCPSARGICNCPLTSSSIFCDCVNGSYYNYMTNMCTVKSVYNGSCASSFGCRTDLSLSCMNGICQCAFGSFWTNITTGCVPLFTYQIPCTASSQCDSSKGLSCPTTAGQCNCPTTSTVYKCDCSSGYYWDATSTNCLPQKPINNSCTTGANYQCKQSLGLVCSASTCTCRPYTVPTTQTSSVCENGVLTVNCGSGYFVKVLSAFYGRFDNTTCIPCAKCQTGCSTSTTTLYGSWFNNRTDVSDTITNGAIGSDPCPGTVKYSQVNFQCI